MSTGDERAARPRVSIGELLDRVRWDYDPEARTVSPLVSTQRFFLDFPWDGAEIDPPAGPPPSPDDRD